MTTLQSLYFSLAIKFNRIAIRWGISNNAFLCKKNGLNAKQACWTRLACNKLIHPSKESRALPLHNKSIHLFALIHYNGAQSARLKRFVLRSERCVDLKAGSSEPCFMCSFNIGAALADECCTLRGAESHPHTHTVARFQQSEISSA